MPKRPQQPHRGRAWERAPHLLTPRRPVWPPTGAWILVSLVNAVDVGQHRAHGASPRRPLQPEALRCYAAGRGLGAALGLSPPAVVRWVTGGGRYLLHRRALPAPPGAGLRPWEDVDDCGRLRGRGWGPAAPELHRHGQSKRPWALGGPRRLTGAPDRAKAPVQGRCLGLGRPRMAPSVGLRGHPEPLLSSV